MTPEPLTSNNDMLEDNDKTATNHTRQHVWLWEPPPTNHGVLTRQGLEHIYNHKYKPGTYTALDNFLNPYWTWLTDLLPLWMAPNMVTTIGGLHCGLAYAVTWLYNANFNATDLPNWLFVLNGVCTILYYTFDCMDGKQARRTKTSSPLGQLFDHGFDCICNLAHVSSVSCYLMTGGTKWFLIKQTSLQFSFFAAQWEEYYTTVLPHSTGNIGVTEVAYGLGFFSIFNAFIDRQAFWTQTLASLLHPILGGTLQDDSWLASHVLSLELRHAVLLVWCVLMTVLVLLSCVRVWNHLDSTRVRWSAFSKLLSPMLLCVASFCIPTHLLQDSTRLVSVAMGLVFSLITKKIIVFSMAKMAYATIQGDVLPFLLSVAWLVLDDNITELGERTVLSLLCGWYAYRLLSWAQLAIIQICDRLDIYCFTIKKKKSKTN